MPRGASRDKVDSAPGGATLTVAATANRLFRSGAASTEIAFGLWLAQLGEIRRDPPRLVFVIERDVSA
jgi:hypothetical protein